jgi:hypothetical protein
MTCIHLGSPKGHWVHACCGGRETRVELFECLSPDRKELLTSPNYGGGQCLVEIDGHRSLQRVTSCLGCSIRDVGGSSSSGAPSSAANPNSGVMSGGFLEPVVVDCDSLSMSETIVMGWIAEGVKGTQQRLILKATGESRQMLQVLGQSVDDAVMSKAISIPREIPGPGWPVWPKSLAMRLGITSNPKRPGIVIDEDSRLWAGGRQVQILLFPATNGWPHWHDLYSRLLSMNARVAIVERDGSTWKIDHCPTFLTWASIVAWMQSSLLVVADNDAPAQFAGTLDVPTIVLTEARSDQLFGHLPSVKMAWPRQDISVEQLLSQISLVGLKTAK